MTLTEKMEIYETLLTNYSVGDCVPLSMLGSFLQSHNIQPARYGCEKMKELLATIPDVVKLHSVTPRPNVSPVWYATLLPRPAEALATAGKASSLRLSQPPAEQAAPEEAGPVKEQTPAKEQEPVKVAEMPRVTGRRAEQFTRLAAGAPKPPENMMPENIFFPPRAQKITNSFLTGEGDQLLPENVLEQIQQDYRKALERDEVIYDEEHKAFSFYTSLHSATGYPICLSFSRSSRSEGSPWYISFIKMDETVEADPELVNYKNCKPGDALINFAFLGSMNGFLQELAEHAQDEVWSFGSDSGEYDYSILKQYINYTFYRLTLQDKICIADDGSFAAFNTGLQSRRLGEDVFAYFEPNEAENRTPWKFSCFCSTDSGEVKERRCYKNMVNMFGEPEPASYFSKISDLLFDSSCQVRLSSDHIFKDNCGRFPMDFLERECVWNPEASELLRRIKETPSHRRAPLFTQLGELICDDCDLFTSMNERLQGALNRTLKRVRRNYKLAVPCFFPTRNVMSMMLPLSFTGTSEPSLVLVCERTLSGDYLGQTVLTLPMAYVDARLLCRPGSEWLNTQKIVSSGNMDIFSLDEG